MVRCEGLDIYMKKHESKLDGMEDEVMSGTTRPDGGIRQSAKSLEDTRDEV